MIPEEFRILMAQQYGQDVADDLCQALEETEPQVSIRLNPHKATHLDSSLLCDPVPWCQGAYYLDQRPPFTFDPLLHAGVYYVQEASSMYISTLVDRYCQHNAQTALDLCAAPGGKSTLLAGQLPQGSLLVSNEPMPKRAQILSENMHKWTRMPQGEYPVHSIVTNNYPADFRALTAAFDLIVADVPCSGEGMFRKDEGAVRDWNLDNVALCWQRQRDIVSDIWHTLVDGGIMIYSTCTFNHFEDEDNVRWICNTLGAEFLEERHFLPGRDRGEGFYCAALRKDGTASDPADRLSADDVIRKVLRTLRIMPPAFTLEGPQIELTYQQALQYLRCEAVRIEAPRGIVTLCYNGFPLGTGKSVGNRINNLYPREWRIRTTYSQEFTMLNS